MSRARDHGIAAVRSDLLTILERLDELELSQAGAYVAMAINCLEPGSFDCTGGAGNGEPS